MICLDTNAVIAVIDLRVPQIRARLERALLDGVTVGVPVIVLYELWYGIKKSARPSANATALATFLTLDVIRWPFEPEDAVEAGDIRATLERVGTTVIGPYDLLIAAQARRRGALLVTANTLEFIRVPGLKTADWALQN
jgi:tRNA(fMet)-specific endonuclease VapC